MISEKQLIKLAIKAGFEKYKRSSLTGKSKIDMTVQVGEYPCGEEVIAFGKLVWKAAIKERSIK